MSKKKTILCILLVTLFVSIGFGQKIKASYSSAIYNEPFTGNVIIYLSKENKSPKDGAVGFDYFPCYAVFVKNISPNESITIDDHAISMHVKNALSNDAEYKYEGVNVDTFKGTVQLSGFVDKHAQKTRANDIAKSIQGVRDVENNITQRFDLSSLPYQIWTGMVSGATRLEPGRLLQVLCADASAAADVTP